MIDFSSASAFFGTERCSSDQIVLDSDQPKVLVIDDHASSRLTAVALLSVEGYQVLEFLP